MVLSLLVLLLLCQNTCPAPIIEILPSYKTATKPVWCQEIKDFSLNLTQEMCTETGSLVLCFEIHSRGLATSDLLGLYGFGTKAHGQVHQFMHSVIQGNHR